jgi:hypothetical protein
VRRIILRDDHDARRPAIEPMDNARPDSAANAAEIADVVEQRIDERARRVAGAGMHHHPGRFVQHREVCVLIEDVQRQRFRCDVRGRHIRKVDRNLVPFAHHQIGFCARRRP